MCRFFAIGCSPNWLLIPGSGHIFRVLEGVSVARKIPDPNEKKHRGLPGSRTEENACAGLFPECATAPCPRRSEIQLLRNGPMRHRVECALLPSLRAVRLSRRAIRCDGPHAMTRL